MRDAEEMTMDKQRKYLRKRQKPYREANRAEKSRLLEEMEAVTGYHRKSLSRLKGPISTQSV